MIPEFLTEHESEFTKNELEYVKYPLFQ